MRKLRDIFWALAIMLGLLQAWATRHAMNPDGISYLDMGEAYFRGDWQNAINAYWSPFYSWLLGLTMATLRPSPYWEFPAVHLANFTIYVGTLACFEFFLSSLIHYYRQRVDDQNNSSVSPLPEWAFRVWGYVLFIWTSLDLVTVSSPTPDMCVAAFVYLATGILLLIGAGRMSWRLFVLLGIILGFGYLAKAVMFPLAFVFLGVGLVAVGDLGKGLPRLVVALLAFSFVAGPWVLALSLQKGRPTFGDSARLSYAWMVNGVPYIHWQGAQPLGSGMPKHAARMVFNEPPTYEFGTPVSGTMPLWYDPSYWYEGVLVRFSLGQQMRVLGRSIRTYYKEVFRDSAGIIAGLIILVFYTLRGHWLSMRWLEPTWVLLVPSIVALGMMAFVLVELRYVGPFIALLFLGVFSSLRFPNSLQSGTMLQAVTIAVLLITMIPTGVRAVYWAASAFVEGIDSSTEADWQVVDALRRMGIRQGDKVALVHSGYPLRDSYWARLARVRIIAHVEDAEGLWRADRNVKSQVMTVLGRTGAKAVIAKEIPSDVAPTMGWKRIPRTGFYVSPLPAWKGP